MTVAGPSTSRGRGVPMDPSSPTNDYPSYSMVDMAASMPGSRLAPSIQLRTKSPLPLFTCSHPIPPASDTIGSTLKLSVLRLLTGEVSSNSSTTPMTESEHLKLMTIHGWRMEMIGLELRQNVLIAPETRNRIGEGIDDEMEGFELADDSDCGLLEGGDEILIRLKPAFSPADLHLPNLPKDHTYALPPGALTQAGTHSGPPSYAVAHIKRAAEPSSHSSSVQAQPNANYHARQYRDYSKGYRIVTVPSAQAGGPALAPNNFGMSPAEIKRAKASNNPAVSGPSKPLGLGLGVEPPAATPAATQYKPAEVKNRRSNSYQKDNQQTGGTRALRSPVLPSSTTGSPAPASTPNIPSPSLTPASSSVAVVRPNTHRTTTTTSYSYFNQEQRGGASSSAMQQVFGSGGPAGQDLMPSGALVIGPGVQGAVGKGTSSAAGVTGPDGSQVPMASIAEYGNAKAFTGFTAAGGEVKQRTKQRTASHSSSHSNGKGTNKRRGSSSRTKSNELLSKKIDWNSGDMVGGVGEQPGDPARAAVEAAERRASAARAAINESLAFSSTNGNGSSKGNGEVRSSKRLDGVELPTLSPMSPPDISVPSPRLRTTSEPFEQPSRSYLKQEDTSPTSPSTVTPGYVSRPSIAQKHSSRGYSRSGSVTDGDWHLVEPPLPPTPDERDDETRGNSPVTYASTPPGRPTANRMVSTGGESAVSKTSKKEGRFFRLAAPGLGLGPRRQNSKNSVPGSDKQEMNFDDEKDVNRPALRERTRSRTQSTPMAFLGDQTNDDGGGEYLDGDGKKLSRADRRYLEFQRSYEAEVTRQAQADRDRALELETRRLDAAKEQRRREQEARQRREKEKWEIWEEIRRRNDGAQQER